ncbi:MAG: DUF1858 domain-containing protein [Acetobacteraceae bacterium]|nr:DUF1858 domain-containing protein [Acetobacteraceae bacterium]
MVGCASITPDLTVNAIMCAWPATLRVFLRHRMGCVGCPIAPFHTVVDAAREYHIDLDMLLAELREAASVPGDANEGMGIADDDPAPDTDQDS